MLNWTIVLDYIKNRLALPSTFIEKTDKQLIDNLKITAIPTFSQFFPDWEFASITPSDNKYKHPSRKDWFYFWDEEELDIYGIKECYFNLGTDLITGHPPFGSMSMEGLKWWALETFRSRFLKPFTMWGYTYKFIPPNILQVFSNPMDLIVVEYEREQPHDLRKILPTLKRNFMDLCLAETQIWLGVMRSHYGDGRVTTPFGEIPLNGDSLKQEGRELLEAVKTKLEEESLPPVVVDVY